MRVKFCGLTKAEDIATANELEPDYVGFVFYKKSKRYLSPEKALELRQRLSEKIKVVGVFVDEELDTVAKLLEENVIDIAQLHGAEDEEYIASLKSLSKKPVIKAFCIKEKADLDKAENSGADGILLDAGMGDGILFNWELLKGFIRPYFLAGGLDCENVRAAAGLKPFAVDVSSGIETDNRKDPEKMRRFMKAVREINGGTKDE
ncbi:MAG: phosphoribosylanthranilate isomerase [Butyrivibrio sp.]|nr:phosphoribosylanthranilate isomerase [Butyrivibrio sp.]